MEISDFKDLDICNIIKTCAESGVQKLTLGGLEIDFTTQVGASANVWTGMPHTPTVPGEAPEPVQRIEMSLEDKELLDELEDNQAMMDDPVQWEQNIIDSHMQHNDGVVDEGPRYNQA